MAPNSTELVTLAELYLTIAAAFGIYLLHLDEQRENKDDGEGDYNEELDEEREGEERREKDYRVEDRSRLLLACMKQDRQAIRSPASSFTSVTAIVDFERLQRAL